MLKDFLQVDAFSSRPLFGNPAAVVFDADDIPTALMQKIAQEMNLSETVFICTPTVPGADYRARIFTPRSELPFAGHPTIAAAHAVLARDLGRGRGLLRQECGIGIIPVEVLAHPAGRLLRMTQGAPKARDPGLPRATVARMLGCAEADLADAPIEVVSTGASWLVVELASQAALTALEPDLGLIQRECAAIGAPGVTAFAEKRDGSPVRLRLRTFAPGEGVAEDPVCGSGNGSVCAFLARHRHAGDAAGSYIAEQGIEIGRDGEIHASWRRDGEALRIMIAGDAATVASGQLHL
ncbi:PhzF family phenazine biosynthesis protein [Roseomonas hellenica]|uniref:PhzF family phenazine biosynthesis protein n=1 Tax=Plastoroseomonas hellenica TaxID=2687306 RepID=A0ABS5F5B1_9PROT|nr:PhzF family phenazine biosynthesis protein [Plastoroseomonas hellenica]MBR0667754.1 PhzF family phenazine biosynthesis protein [Plastoroseomonas hellenica]